MDAEKMDKKTKDTYISLEMIPECQIPLVIKTGDINYDEEGYLRPHNCIRFSKAIETPSNEEETSPENKTLNSKEKELPKNIKETVVSAKEISVHIQTSNEIDNGDRGQNNEQKSHTKFTLQNELLNHGSEINNKGHEQNTFQMRRLERNAAFKIYDRMVEPRPEIDVSIDPLPELPETSEVAPINQHKNSQKPKELCTISKSISTVPHETGLDMSDASISDLPRLPYPPNMEVKRCQHILIGACTCFVVMMVIVGICFMAYYIPISYTVNSRENTTAINEVAMTASDVAVTTNVIVVMTTKDVAVTTNNVATATNNVATTSTIVNATTNDVECFNFKVNCNRFIVEKKITANTQDQQNQKLAQAAGTGNITRVCQLLKCGVSANSVDTKGHTPLERAAEKGHVNVAQLLLVYNASVDKAHANRSGNTPFYAASAKGHTEVMKLLLTYNASVDQADQFGWSPIHIASQNGHTEVVKLLLTYNASVDQTLLSGKTPLYLASKYGHTEVVKLLLTYNASVDQTLLSGKTPLYLASKYGHTEVVKLLLKYNASVDQGLTSNYTPLYFASLKGHIEVVKMLLTYNASVNKSNIHGWTPLHAAVWYNRNAIVELLCTAGAHVNAQTVRYIRGYRVAAGSTPLHMAVINRNTIIANTLISHKVELLNNKKGKTALDISRQQKSSDITVVLDCT